MGQAAGGADLLGLHNVAGPAKIGSECGKHSKQLDPRRQRICLLAQLVSCFGGTGSKKTGLRNESCVEYKSESGVTPMVTPSGVKYYNFGVIKHTTGLFRLTRVISQRKSLV